MSKNKPNTLMTHGDYEPKLRSVVRPSMHPYPGNWLAIVHAVVYHALAVSEFRAEIRCGYCINVNTVYDNYTKHMQKQMIFSIIGLKKSSH